jgi:hypothetical protein
MYCTERSYCPLPQRSYCSSDHPLSTSISCCLRSGHDDFQRVSQRMAPEKIAIILSQSGDSWKNHLIEHVWAIESNLCSTRFLQHFWCLPLSMSKHNEYLNMIAHAWSLNAPKAGTRSCKTVCDWRTCSSTPQDMVAACQMAQVPTARSSVNSSLLDLLEGL